MIEIIGINKTHIKEYGEIYAKAFSGEPWNDALLILKIKVWLEYILSRQVKVFCLRFMKDMVSKKKKKSY